MSLALNLAGLFHSLRFLHPFPVDLSKHKQYTVGLLMIQKVGKTIFWQFLRSERKKQMPRWLA